MKHFFIGFCIPFSVCLAVVSLYGIMYLFITYFSKYMRPELIGGIIGLLFICTISGFFWMAVNSDDNGPE